MPETNLAILERMNGAFNRGDVDAGTEDFAPDAELLDLANAPDQAQAVKGVEAIREAWTLWSAAFDELRAETEELTDLGDVIISGTHWQGRGRESGVSIDLRQFGLYEFRDGKVTRAILGFESKQAALEAAGRGEEA
jgi:ketosteroid isomerase-like protein